MQSNTFYAYFKNYILNCFLQKGISHNKMIFDK